VACMTIRLFWDRNRRVHLGSYPLERLARSDAVADLGACPTMRPISFFRRQAPQSIVNAMAEYQAMMDAIRDGLVAKVISDYPDDPMERAIMWTISEWRVNAVG